MGMENGGKTTDETRPTYWLDACEDDDIIPCDLIGGFGDSVHQDCVGDDQAFFGGIDHILDCIKNGNGLPSSPQPIPIHGDGMEISTFFENGEDGEIRVFEMEDEKLTVSYTTENLNSEELRGTCQQDNGSIVSNGHFKQTNRNSDVNDEKRKLGPVDSPIKIENSSPEFSRDRGVATEERRGKRARFRGGYEDDRFVSSRGRDYVRERDGSGRKDIGIGKKPVGRIGNNLGEESMVAGTEKEGIEIREVIGRGIGWDQKILFFVWALMKLIVPVPQMVRKVNLRSFSRTMELWRRRTVG